MVYFRSIRSYYTILLYIFFIYKIWECLKGLILNHFVNIFFTFILFYTFAFDTDNRLSKCSILWFRSPLILPFSRFHYKHFLFTFSLWAIINQTTLFYLFIFFCGLIHIILKFQRHQLFLIPLLRMVGVCQRHRVIERSILLSYNKFIALMTILIY